MPIEEGLFVGFTIGDELGEIPGAPILEPEAAYLYQQLRPMVEDDEDTGWVTAHLCAVLMKPVELTMQLANADGDKPGWRQAVDLDHAPARLLPWLGQFNGTPLEDTEPEGEQRRKIREARGSHRGTTRAVISDLMATLGGERRVTLIEREGSAFENTFRTLPGETPNPAAAEAAIKNRQTKPLGVVNTLIVSDSPLIDEGTLPIDVATGTIDKATLSDIT
jgi:hypothetical protein